MRRWIRRLATSGLVVAVMMLISSGSAEAKLTANHNETVLRSRH